ncbi:MAG: hypothetical protein IKD94_07440 [Erysipelotrichaceae bacterium]|nr:hypothetical protein [Erysipelotrichaceae bacterium]
MEITDNDVFYEFIEKYDSDSEHHLVGEVDYHLLSDDKPYEGLKSHREALRFVFDCLAKQSIEDQENVRIILGDDTADKLQPLVYDLDKAKASPLKPQEFFYCPNIVKTDYYGSVCYDAKWKPDDQNFGATVPYWYALMEPVHGRRNRPEDFRKVNEVLFPNGTDTLDIYEWTTDWSDFFDDGHEWYGACCWSVYDKTLNRYVVMLVSATD